MKIPAAICALVLLGGCATTSPEEDWLASAEVVARLEREQGARVEVMGFSRRAAGDSLAWLEPYPAVSSRPRTDYRLVRGDAGVVLEARADGSYSGLFRRIRIDPARQPVVEWRWQVGNPLLAPEAGFGASEDSAARFIVSFHGDPKKIDFHDRVQYRLAKALTGQAMPYATLMYIWSNRLPVGSVFEHPLTDRMRGIVVGSGAEGVGEWQSYRRNIREDYLRVFGEEPGDIVSVGIMTDTDQTRQKARTLYGDVIFSMDQSP